MIARNRRPPSTVAAAQFSTVSRAFMVEPSAQAAAGGCSQSFLPDFCSIRTLLAAVIVAELLALVLVLGTAASGEGFWQALGILSLFIQWVSLCSMALLCLVRRWLCRLDNRAAGLICYGIVLAVTLAVSATGLVLARYLGVVPTDTHYAPWVLRHLGISAIVGAVLLRFLYLGHQQGLHLQAQAEARVEALQARIRPHFLFNSMNTIAALIRTRPAEAEAAVEDLSDLFRASLADSARVVTWAEELEIARRYLELEQLRLGERLRVNWDVDTLPAQTPLPPLILQPLLENAIYHGVEQLAEGGTIRVTANLDSKRIAITIANPLPRGTPTVTRAGNRMALDNIRERLRLAYQGRGGVELDTDGGQCVVRVIIPLVEDES